MAKASATEAKEAKELRFQENRFIGAKIRDEVSEILQQKLTQEQLEIQHKQQLCKTVAEERSIAPARARAHVLKQKEETVKEIRKDLEEQRAARLKEEQDEAERRADDIKKLKASLIHQPKVKILDPTETANVGLLGEMSLLEMKERLQTKKVFRSHPPRQPHVSYQWLEYRSLNKKRPSKREKRSLRRNKTNPRTFRNEF